MDERIRAERDFVKQRQRERNRARRWMGYVGDGAELITGVRSGWLTVRLYGSSDVVIEARNYGKVMPVPGACIEIREVREVGRAFYEIVGYAEGTDWSP